MAKKRERTPANLSHVVGRQVEAVRKRLHISQKELSTRLTELGVVMRQVTIARLETGKRRVTVDEALSLAAALGVNPTFLFSGEFTNERDIRVAPKFDVSPNQVRYWFDGNLPLPGTDERTYFELIPDEELMARQLRGIAHLKESVNHLVRALGAKDTREALYALRLIKTEIERQQEGLELEQRRAHEKREEE